MKVEKAKAKVKAKVKAKAKVKGESLTESFNNPALLLGSLCFAEKSVWNVYDDLSEQRLKNNLILTRSERLEIHDAETSLLAAYAKLCRLSDRRMRAVMAAKKGGAK